MPSFDIVSEVNKVELNNSIDQVSKELITRFDFKGSNSTIELKEEKEELSLVIVTDDDFKLSQIYDILILKISKRNIDSKILAEGKKEKVSGNRIKETIAIKNGIDQELGKKINKYIKDTKIKITSSIQGETVRVSGIKRDDLQNIMQLIKKDITELPLQFINFRD